VRGPAVVGPRVVLIVIRHRRRTYIRQGRFCAQNVTVPSGDRVQPDDRTRENELVELAPPTSDTLG